MKRLFMICLVMAVLALSACAPAAQPQGTTAPPETTAAPVETTTPIQETTLPEEDPLVTEFKELLTFTGDSDPWYNYALKSYYDEPAGIDIFKLVYSAPWQGSELTQEEKDFLISKNLEIEIFNVNKYPVEKIDEVLQKYFGITFEDAEGVGLDKMVYNPDTNSYYHLHGDFEAGYPTVSNVAAQEDGSYIVYYESVDGSCAVTLKKAENGEYQILSNVLIIE